MGKSYPSRNEGLVSCIYCQEEYYGTRGVHLCPDHAAELAEWFNERLRDDV